LIDVTWHCDVDDKERTIQTLRSIGASFWAGNGVSDDVEVIRMSMAAARADHSSNGTTRRLLRAPVRLHGQTSGC
jgi:hypothetical protein